jgi:hypothetical protein
LGEEARAMSALRVLPWAFHVAIEYVAGIFLVVSPFVFEYTDSPALPVLLLAGVIALAAAVLSRGALGVYGILPVGVQALIDYLLAFALMIAPFAFGFRDEADALLVSVMTGLGLLVVSLLTRYPQPAPAPARPTTREITEPEAGTRSDPDLPAWVQGADDEPEHDPERDSHDPQRDPREEPEYQEADEADADRRG